jgi:hypothetical protein
MVSGYDPNKPGTQTLTVTYKGMKTTYRVTVEEIKADSLAILDMPVLEYYVGDSIDLSAGTLSVRYNNGATEIVPMTDPRVEISGFDSSKPGTKTVTVSFGGKTVKFKVTVKKSETPVSKNLTIDGEPAESITKAFKSIKSGDHTIMVTADYTEKSITIPKGLGTITLICDGGVTLTADTITANSNLVLDDVTLAGTKAGKYTAVKANADFTANTGTYSNITVAGKADLSDLTVNGTVKLSAKADKNGLVTDTLTGVTVTKGVNSNNNVIFADCPSLGTINVKGTVKITGEATKAVALTASSKSGVSEVENLTVEKKVSIANKLFADGLTANGAVDVKGDANITDSTIAGKLSVKAYLSVNGDVYCGSAISCGQLSSDETANLTYQSLAITKNGIAENSADITVKVIYKNGDPVQFKPGDKKAVVVKSLKLPKGVEYNPVLKLHEDCSKTGTLKFDKNKVILV